MTGYTKLFGSIIASTIWREAKETKIVWITMMALANRDGIVEASIPGLADFAKVTLRECEAALKTLMDPDPYSRTKEHQGRRIVEIDGGWRLLNHGKYRDKLGAEERKEYKRDWDQRNRNSRPNSQQRTPDKNPTTPDNPRQKEPKSDSNPTHPTHTEAAPSQKHLRSISEASPKAVQVPSPTGSDLEKQALEIYQLYPRKVGRPKATQKIKKAIQAHGFDLVKTATKRFAKAWEKAGDDMQFCPHPATWFHQERFNDAPETWERGVDPNPAKAKEINIFDSL